MRIILITNKSEYCQINYIFANIDEFLIIHTVRGDKKQALEKHQSILQTS